MEHSPAMPSPDEFDRQLRELTSGTAGAPRFRELSAEERARLAAQRRRAPWRDRTKAAKPGKPGPRPRRQRPAAGRRPPRLRVVGGRTAPAPGSRRQRLRSAAKATAVLAGFIALLIVLHLIGLGPQ